MAGAAVVLALVLVPIVGVQLVSGKSSSSKGATKALSGVLAPASYSAISAPCASNTHATGGGFGVFNGFNPATKTGTRTRPQVNFPPGKGKWRAQVASQGPMQDAATLVTYTRCERNSFSTAKSRVVGAQPVSPNQAVTLFMTCPVGTHVTGGGYSVTPAFLATAAANSTSQMVIVQSRRTTSRVWAVTGVNPAQPATQLSGYALCEKNEGVQISVKSSFATLLSSTRATVAPKCTGSTHSVSGGFIVTPTKTNDNVPIVDTSVPSGSQAWTTAAYADGSVTGGSLTGYVYCKSNHPPKN